MNESQEQARVLVTGSAGFIGGYVVEELLERGYAQMGAWASPGYTIGEPVSNERLRMLFCNVFLRYGAATRFWEGLTCAR